MKWKLERKDRKIVERKEKFAENKEQKMKWKLKVRRKELKEIEKQIFHFFPLILWLSFGKILISLSFLISIKKLKQRKKFKERKIGTDKKKKKQ